ncbi:MAG: PDZ domain-containing protein [Bacteroidota bacterium]
MKKTFPFFTILMVGLFYTLSNQVQAQNTQLLRQPTVSENSVVFVYANDLWIVDKQGGQASRLTSGMGGETRPHFSPDGTMIAFTGQYDGNLDLFIVPATGGEPKRLTWHPGADLAHGWTPDGEILFTSSRKGHPTQEARFFTISTDGGMPEELPIPRANKGELSEDGKMIAYEQFSFWDPEWRNYRGGQAQPIWIVDMKSLELKKTPRSDSERHTDPVWHDGVLYFLSELDYANNIWSFNPDTDELKQVTFHSDFDVKSLDAGGGDIVYEQGGYLHLLNPETGDSQQLNITVSGDMNRARPRWVNVSANQLTNASLSPTGKRAIFQFRGDILTVPKKEGSWRNITKSSGTADRYPIWSPDGKNIAWFSDQSGEYTLMISDQAGLEEPRSISLPNPTFYFRPDWSPDSKFIAYTDTDYNLWYVNVESGEAKKVDTERYAHPNRSLNPVWSPDSKWIAYARILDNQLKAIKAHNIETGKTIQLTDGLSDAITPVWDANGKYLYFLASTNFGLNTGWLDMSSYNIPTTRGLYAIVLSKEDPSPLLPLSDEEGDLIEKSEDEDSSEEKGKDKSKKEVTVTIDTEDIDQRIIDIDIPLRNYTGLVPGPEGHVFYFESVPNSGTRLHRYSLKDRKSIEFLSSAQFATTSNDRKTLLFRSGSNWGIVKTTGGAKKPSDGRLSLNRMRIKVDPQEEYKQIFKEGWRFMRDFLYVDNVHGAPWDDVLEWYSPWIDHVRHRSDLNYVIDIMSGEVAVGHSYVSGGDFPSLTSDRIGLLGADVVPHRGAFRIDKIYQGENWNPGLRSPLSGPGINIEEGEYIVAVDGEPVSADRNFFSYFEGTANRQVNLMINDKANMNGARLVTIQTVSSENQLRTRDWMENNRKKVDELSDGKLAYVWVPNTGFGGYTYFNRYYFAQQHKQGAVIDERNNGGGSAADYIVDVLNRDLHGYFNSRANDRKPFTTPGAGLWGPKVMIINERAGSGGDLLPYLFRKMEIGPLIGTQTWGGLVGTWDTPRFIDNGRMVAPRGGFFDLNGEWAVEGVGVAPDIEVFQTPKDVAEGRDPQLERAVREAMLLLKTESVELKPEPAPPVRWKRPSTKKN